MTTLDSAWSMARAMLIPEASRMRMVGRFMGGESMKEVAAYCHLRQPVVEEVIRMAMNAKRGDRSMRTKRKSAKKAVKKAAPKSRAKKPNKRKYPSGGG